MPLSRMATSTLPDVDHAGAGALMLLNSYTTTPVRLLDIVSLRSARSCWGERL